MFWKYLRALSRCMLVACLVGLGFLTACSTRGSNSQSSSTASVRTSAVPAIQEVLLPCADGAPRNKAGVCPPFPPCAKRCYLGAVKEVAKSCWNHPEYENQTAKDGGRCEWAFEPGDYHLNSLPSPPYAPVSVSEGVSPSLDNLSSGLPTPTQAWNPLLPNSVEGVSSALPIPGASGALPQTRPPAALQGGNR